MARALFTGKPLSVAAFYRRSAQRAVDRILTDCPIQAILCFCSPMAEYVFRSPFNNESTNQRITSNDSTNNESTNQRITTNESTNNESTNNESTNNESTTPPAKVMDLVDVDSDKWAQYAKKCTGWKRFIYRMEAKRLASYEHKVAHSFDAAVLVSDREAAFLRSRMLQNDAILAVENGVDLDYFAPYPSVWHRTEGSPCTLVFCGLMDYYPNEDAMVWFVHHVFPVIREATKDAQLLIVGARPSKAVLQLSRIQGVTVTGKVDDVRPYVQSADISIAPIRVARGVQNKVLEAMAMAKPVVATQQAVEGIRARAGKDLLVVPDDPHAFASGVTSLWQDAELAGNMARHARSTMMASYSWEEQLKPLHALLCSARRRGWNGEGFETK
jgi:sugar transferase (PEP-CTERM/EpsH1 system associated)